METKQLGTTEQDLALAGELLRQGQLVAFPTETVYGLGADALNETAVAQIYAAKGRPSDNPPSQLMPASSTRMAAPFSPAQAKNSRLNAPSTALRSRLGQSQ